MAKVTGTTVDAYANALEWDCFSFDKTTLIIRNTDVVNTLKVKVSVLADKTGTEYPLELAAGVTERVLVAGDNQMVNLLSAYHSLCVAVKSNVAGAVATYQVDYAGGLQR